MECTKCKRPNRSEANYCKWCGEAMEIKTDHLLDELVGLINIKARLQELLKTCEGIALRAQKTGVKVRLGMDMVLVGNAGTGKSELVKALEKLLYANGITKKPKAMVVDAADFEDFSSKSDKRDNWQENIKNAKGGMLVIENAQKLLPKGESDQVNKLDRLFKCMNGEWVNDPIVILTGLSGLKGFMQNNPDIASRFEYHFDLPDFNVDELTAICEMKLKSAEYGLKLSEEAHQKLENVFKYELRNRESNLENGDLAAAKAEEIFSNVMRRDHSATDVVANDIKGKEFRRKTYDDILKELDDFVGIEEIKDSLQKIVSKLDLQTERNGSDAKREIKDHFLFLGNPGTGKTTIARIFADILNSLEILPIGQLIEVSRKELVSGYQGQTALAVEAAVNRAMGGVLFIDEAYTLKQDDNDTYGLEAINTLLKLVEDNRGKFVAIAAGYTKEMQDFVSANSGMKSRFNETINFKDYSPAELTEIFRRLVKKEKLQLSPDAEQNIENYFKKIYISRDVSTFGNAREVRNVFDKALKNQSTRIQALRNTPDFKPECLNILTRADIEGEENTKEKDINTILAELDEFIGMDSVKKEIKSMATKLTIDRKMMEMGYGDAELTNVHIMLTGNPGTGKTTVANKLGEIFKAIGLLPSSKVVVKEPKDILSSYVNGSSKRMDKACDEAMGGTLLIDEAYNLAKVDDMGNVDKTGVEAVEALMTRMSKDAGKFVTIVAGYKEPIERFVDKANPGLKRRFTVQLNIDDYTGDELAEIFLLNARKGKLTLTDEARKRLFKLTHQMVDTKGKNFGNAGDVIKILTEAKTRKANRLAALMDAGQEITQELFTTLDAADIPYDEPKALKKDDYLKELNELIGLASVKQDICDMADYIEVERAKSKAFGKKFQGLGDHYIFTGNPGTGKTTVARIMANTLFSLGILPTNKLVETNREQLVGAYLGHSAKNTREVFEKAIGGILFIDEAYALVQGDNDSFGRESLETLLILMEDRKSVV